MLILDRCYRMKTISLLTLLFIATPVIATENIPDSFQICLGEAANQRAGFEGGIKNIEVTSSFRAENTTYYYANVISNYDGHWGIVVQQSGDTCSFVGDSYVAESGLYGDMSNHIVKQWTIQKSKPRIKLVGKEKFKEQVRDPFFQWHPGEIEAYKELSVW